MVARLGQRYCLDCHAAAQRAYRERVKARQRSAAWELAAAKVQLETAAWSQR
jgi:hypothetical protein